VIDALIATAIDIGAALIVNTHDAAVADRLIRSVVHARRPTR